MDTRCLSRPFSVYPAFWEWAMPDGKQIFMIQQGKVSSDNELYVVEGGSGSVPSGPTGPIGTLPIKVDSQGRIIVRVV